MTLLSQLFRNLSSILSRIWITGCLLGLTLSAQPSTQGMSMEELMRQANELLRQQGIDVDGSNHGHDEPAHGHDTPPAPEPMAAPVSTSKKLGIQEIYKDPDIWPAEIVLIESVEFQGGLRLTAGTPVRFAGFSDIENVSVDYQDYALTLPVGFTDVEERANDVASGKAKAEGFRGRLVEQLGDRVGVLNGGQVQPATPDGLAEADFFLFFFGSNACGWCDRYSKTFVKEVDRAKRAHPGKVKVILASVDNNMSEFQKKYRKVKADAGMTSGDRYFINEFSRLHPKIRQIPQPSLMLFNANGRLIDSATRRNSDTRELEQLVKQLSQKLDNRESYIPAWTKLKYVPPTDTFASTAPAFETLTIQKSPDPTITGPEPYPATDSSGRAIPGLVMYDNTARGSRIPALTLQKIYNETGTNYQYILAFRQVLGQTYGSSKPLLNAWLETTTTRGPLADSDLSARVSDFKEIHAKYVRWKDTAISNGVNDFRKPIYALPQTIVDNRVVLRASTSDPKPLEILFTISGKPENASLKTGNITWMKTDMDAFLRLIPNIDLLVSQLGKEESRLAQEKSQKVNKAQNIDALFN
ncbi:MAG: hypothetical protein AAF212_12930 [Verrucomicrobiota bacterium]